MGRPYTGKISIGEWRVRKRVRNRKTGEEHDVVYVYERATRYDRELKKTVRVYTKLLGRWDEETGQIVPTRPRKKPRTDTGKQNVESSGSCRGNAGEAGLASAGGMRAGLADILNHVGDTSGIKAALLASFARKDAQLIDTIAQFIVATNNPLASLEQWQINHETPCSDPISEETCSDLFKRVGLNEDAIQKFFAQRAKRLGKNGTLALDASLFPSQGKKPKKDFHDCNREHDGLETKRVVILLSEGDREPIAFAMRRGNMPDIKSLECALEETSCHSLKKPLVVTDNDCSSEENVLCHASKNMNFLARATNRSAWIKDIVDKCIDSKELEKLSSTCTLDTSVKRVSHAAAHPFEKIGNKRKGDIGQEESTSSMPRLYVHVYFSTEQSLADGQELTENIFDAREKFVNDRELMTKKELDFANRFLSESDTKRVGRYSIQFNEDAFAEAKKYFGILVLLSNSAKDPEATLVAYRARTEIEHVFDIHKNHHEERMSGTRHDEHLRGRLFVQFVALCYHANLSSQIEHMKDKLGKVKNEDGKTKERLDLENDLKTFLQERSLRQVLQWFDCVERSDVNTASARYRWSGESIRRDDLFFELLGMKPRGQSAAQPYGRAF